ncbi:hypothetical protein R6Q57_006499 [Mikania cordata]
MADFEAPSFSLGLDFDILDSDSQIATENDDNKAPSLSNHFSVAGTIFEDDDEDFETLTIVDSDSENQGSSPKLKRLRRGSTVKEMVSSDSSKRKEDLQSSVVVDDDDIDDFSSQEGEHLSIHHHSVCNSSKFPINGHGVLTKQAGKRKHNVLNDKHSFLNDPESVITSCNKPPFPKLTVSPLRRFQLVDSDDDFDDPIFISESATNKNCSGSESYMNRVPPDFVHGVGLNQQGKLNDLANTKTRKDLWEDFQPEKSFCIPTPALDEVCKEYFSSMKDKSKSQSNIGKNNQDIHVTSSVVDLDDPCPPSHHYFFHNDPRVQDLVRTRLPNFFPLNAANRNSEQPSTSNIDYIGQFSNGDKPKQAARMNKAARTNKAETSSRKNSSKSKTQDSSQGFMNAKLNTKKEIPKDAGKRRVQADGQVAGAGHWFTNQDGKKVYVSKNGQELTGRAAYTLYKKLSEAVHYWNTGTKSRNIFSVQYLQDYASTSNLLANLPDFKNLTHLELTMEIRKSTIEALMKFLNCCPNLQSLYFSEGFSHDVCLVENDLIWSSVPKCISSCLKMLNFKKFHGNDSEICFLKCILQHAFVFKKMNISCCENLFRDPNRRNEMKKALETSSKGSKSCVVTFS